MSGPRSYRIVRDASAMQARIAEHLADRGPAGEDDVRTELCIASLQRFRAAVHQLERAKRISSTGGVLRIPGDLRSVREMPNRALKNERHTCAVCGAVETCCHVEISDGGYVTIHGEAP